MKRFEKSSGLVLVGILLTAQLACAGETAEVLRLKVTKKSILYANGQEVTLEALDQKLAQLYQAGGEVWYYREEGKSEPPPVAREAVGLIVKRQLPISMSSKPDYSDVIGPDGLVRPRKSA